jgi:glycosyltransferase involved in cell wall biosynthesis
MKKIDLGIVTNYFAPDTQAVAVRMVHLARALEADNFDLTIYTSKKSEKNSEFRIRCNFFSSGSNKDNVPVRLLKELSYSVENFFRLLFSNHDYYLVTSPPFTIAFFSCLAIIIRGKKYILDVRDEYPEAYFEEGFVKENGVGGRFLKYLEKFLYRHATIITTVTERIKRKLERKSPGSLVWLLRNGYADGFSPAPYQKNSPFTIVFHGNMGKFQHPKLVVDIAELCLQQNLDVKFDIYGWGNNSSILTENPLPNLQHHGELSGQEVRQLLPHAHLGISFQKNSEISKNSFPSKVFEFIGAGLPSIVTPVSEAGDFIEQHHLGFQFNPDDKEKIFEKIKALISDSQLYRSLKDSTLRIREELSRKRVCEDFSKNLYSFIRAKESSPAR